jgi:nucleotidyltransferase substrate binding protein (TIGR01987 family)
MDKELLLSDYKQALDRLGDALQRDATDDVIKAGCIQYFEFTFELAWKTLKAIAYEYGEQDCNAPKSALKFAFKNDWILDEELWLDMLRARNRMPHTYKASDALEVFQRLPSFYDGLRNLSELLDAGE